MRRLAVVALAVSIALIAGCRSSDLDELARAGQLILREESQTALRETWDVYALALEWSAGLDLAAEIDDSRFPDWARPEYAACIHWHETATYTRFNSRRQPGEPLQIEETASGEGWILVKKNLEFHILELDVGLGDESEVWIDDWGPPEGEAS